MSFLAYLFGFLAAGGNAAANVLQRAANRREGNRDQQFTLGLVRNLLSDRLWLAGIGAMACSFFLQAAGLGFGSLAGVEPLLVLELPITLVISRLWLKERLDRRAWISIVSMTASTVGLIASLGPSAGRSRGIEWWVWLVAIAATSGGIALCYLLGLRSKDDSKRAAVLGIGTGICYGMAASLVKGMTSVFGDGGIAAVFQSWQLYGAIAVGAFAVWMHQNAVSAAKLVVAQPGVTLGDPYVSIVWGATVFGESMRGGAWVAAAVVSAVLLSASAVVLAGSRSTSQDAQDQPAAAAAA